MITFKHQTLLGAILWLVTPSLALAYNYKTHAKIVERAVDSMQALSRTVPLSPPAPNGVAQADFDDYLAAVREAPPRLELLRTGLPNKLQGSGMSALPFDGPGDEPYPFPTKNTSKCPLNPNHPRDNLSNLSVFQIRDFHYRPKRTAAHCGLEPMASDSESTLGPVLGWHAAGIDDHFADTVLWFRPTSVGGAGVVKELAIDATNVALGVIIAPFFCLEALFSGNVCDPDDIVALANKYNPVIEIEGMVPGVGDIRGGDYTGMWHFIDVDPARDHGRFNHVPGLYYPEAGPESSGGGPGAVDVAIMVFADTSGLSLNAGDSNGVDNYGSHDEVDRGSSAHWMTFTIAHTEFAPLDSLALHGWNKFTQSGGTADGLGWPLHAIGDGAAPHHVIGSSAWGHRPYEDGVENFHWLHFPEGEADKDAQMSRILTRGYSWWRLLRSNPNIRAYIRALAVETRSLVAANNDLAYGDLASTLYLADKGAATLLTSPATDDKRDLLELSAAAAVAFLAFAEDHMTDPGQEVFECPVGSKFTVEHGCVGGLPLSLCAYELPSCASDVDCAAGYVCTDGCCLIDVL